MSRAEDIKQRIDLTSYVEKRANDKIPYSGKIRCPIPTHTDDTPSFAINTSGKSWHCYGACNRGGTVIDFVMAMDNVDFQTAMDILDGGNYHNGNGYKQPQPPKPQPKFDFGDMDGYAQKKYKEPNADKFRKWGCHEVEYRGEIFMAMPTRDTIDRWRSLTGSGTKCQPDPTNAIVIEKMQTRKRKKNEGISPEPEDYVQAQWFGLDEAKTWEKFCGKNLVLCNGQTSTMIAQSYGVPAFCKTDGENTIPVWLIPELVELLSSGWKLWVALDCDNDGKGHDVAKKIIMQLFQFAPVFIDLRGKDGYDLADFCVTHKDKSWQALRDYVAPLPGNVLSDVVVDIERGIQELARAQKIDAKKQLPSLLDDLEQKMGIVRGSIVQKTEKQETIRDMMADFAKVLDNPNPLPGIKTGLTMLDYRLGGLVEGVYTFMGETKMGKTTLGISIAAHILKHEQLPGFIVIGEANRRQIVQRLVGYLAHVPWKSIKTGVIKTEVNGEVKFIRFTPEQVNLIRTAFLDIQKWENDGLLIMRDYDKSLTTSGIQSQLKQAVDKYGVRWALMDSADNIPTTGEINEYDRISKAMFAFESMAVQNNIPVIVTSQVGRNTKGRANRMPGTHDGLGSNHVEGKSYALMSLYNHWKLVEIGELQEQDGDEVKYHPKGTALINVVASRDDATGSPVVCKWDGGIGWYNYQNTNTKG